MKPSIHIDEQLIRIDTDQFLLSIVFKKQSTKELERSSTHHPDEISVIRAGDASNSLHKIKGETRKCIICGKEFITKRSNKKYCSKQCVKKNAVNYNREWARKHKTLKVSKENPELDQTLKEIEQRKSEPYKITPPVN
jgi:endogenous inhibitor of DNA gyrase (YacG/DUF329 family)